MKFSSVALVGGLATLASAECKHADNEWKPRDDYGGPNRCEPKMVKPGMPYAGPTDSGFSILPIDPSPTGKYPTEVTSTKTQYVTVTATASPSACGNPKPVTTHKVVVGAGGQLVYSPNQVEAAVGDVVEFDFLALNHTVTQSSFDKPCEGNGGFKTGFNQFNPTNTSGLHIRTFTVTESKPYWFYCGQGNHCQQGMVFGINTRGKMNEFIEKAKATPPKTPPTSPSPVPNPSTPGYPTTTTAPGAVTTVTVGLKNGTELRFEPPYLMNKKKGDIIRFDFRALNHTLTESSFNDPCKKLDKANAIDSGFQPNRADIPNAKIFDVTLDSDANMPRWFYCKQANGQPNGHCANGMVFAINPKSKEQFDQFLDKAKATLPKIRGRGLQLGETA